jgi:hypothetical protein
MNPGLILKLEDAPRGARLIVCGGRNYGCMFDHYPNEIARQQDAERVQRERNRLFEVLDLLAPREIAQGEAVGADSLAKTWAAKRGVPCARFPALWNIEGKSAGPKRNRRMFSGFEPDGTVAFPGGRGTADMENVTIDGGAWLVRVR